MAGPDSERGDEESSGVAQRFNGPCSNEVRERKEKRESDSARVRRGRGVSDLAEER
jgi:hypothetical protein